ncbi:MAG: single-stranded-DNA-specific exonuclease RecJ [Lachnospiraceae bacterium]
MAKWVVAAKKADFNKIGEKFQISPVIARILRNRDLIEEQELEDFLHADMSKLTSPFLLKGMEEGTMLLLEKMKDKKKIRVIGDYDVDGICSATILVKGIRACGGEVDTIIPHRMKDGYGINEQLIIDAKSDNIDTIITCDNGIAAIEAISYAKDQGMTCIITDHHECVYEMVGEEKQYLLPDADVIINPKQPGCGYRGKAICGAVVAYKFIESLLEKCNVCTDLLEELMELAGVATVCDVMELIGENRIFVKAALESMEDCKNIGLKALIEANELSKQTITAYSLGFVIGPCINATGRLDTAMAAFQLFETSSIKEAKEIALHLKELNSLRKDMTLQYVEEAKMMVEEMEQSDTVIVLYLPECHESLAGIIAGRIRETYYKPTFVLTKALEEENGEIVAKGSARSIEGYHIYEEMTKCKEYFLKYGGHAMAAGLSLLEKDIDLFRKKINELCVLTKEQLEEKITIDVPMPLNYVTIPFIKELEILEPFGVGNKKPIFAQKELTFYEMRLMGKEKNMAKFLAKDETNATYELILFRELERFEKVVSEKYGSECLEQLINIRNHKSIKMDIIYEPSINTFRGQESLQFIIKDFK